MAAFAFLLSRDGAEVPPATAFVARVSSALQERSPGRVLPVEGPGFVGAFAGPLGELYRDGPRLILCDGTPILRSSGAVEEEGARALAAALEDPTPGRLEGLAGSFAACLYEGESGNLTLIRDRFGIRPLYYAEEGGRVWVGSECKVLQAMGLETWIHPPAFREAILYRWVTGSEHLFAPVRVVPMGGMVRFARGEEGREERYWRIHIEAEEERPGDFERYQGLVEGALRAFLRRVAGKGQRVGVLLSGGVDSSLLMALAREELEDPIAYTASIDGFDNFELARASLVARHLGVDHHVVKVDPSRFHTDLDYIVRRLEELPRHPNNLVLLQLLRRAAAEVDILLEGDAADTLFGLSVAPSLRHLGRKKRWLRLIPRPLRGLFVRALERIPTERTWRLAGIAAWDIAQYLMARNHAEYRPRIRRVLGLTHGNPAFWETSDFSADLDIDEMRRANILASGVQGSFLRHDRLSRPLGVETLMPYVSPEAVEVAQRMPRSLSYRGLSKPVLRALCDRYLPPEVSRWGKGGFDVPWRVWLFRELADRCREAERFLADGRHLPRGFMSTALATMDPEAAWTGLSLYLLLRSFGMEPSSLQEEEGVSGTGAAPFGGLRGEGGERGTAGGGRADAPLWPGGGR